MDNPDHAILDVLRRHIRATDTLMLLEGEMHEKVNDVTESAPIDVDFLNEYLTEYNEQVDELETEVDDTWEQLTQWAIG